MANKEIVGWFTRGGKHIPRYERVAKECPPQYRYDKVKEKRKMLENKTYSEGTYDIDTLAPVTYKEGYSVSFCQLGDKYLDEEYNELIAKFLAHSSDGKASLGKFEGTPELSFHVLSKREAIKLAKEFNQISIWDWEKGNKDWRKGEIYTGGTGRRASR